LSWGAIAGVALFSVLYFADIFLKASQKCFWFDELFTVYLCRLPDFKSTWTAVAHGADFNPPLFYLMFLWVAAWCSWGGKSVLVRYAGAAILLLTTIGIVRKWSYPPLLAQTHIKADVERFKNLKTGEHMLFSVYDPMGRKMELIKH
jgi:hypothetical protein